MRPLQHQVPTHEVLDKDQGDGHAGTKHRKVGQGTLQRDALYRMSSRMLGSSAKVVLQVVSTRSQ
jgi:hypothetical protein